MTWNVIHVLDELGYSVATNARPFEDFSLYEDMKLPKRCKVTNQFTHHDALNVHISSFTMPNDIESKKQIFYCIYPPKDSKMIPDFVDEVWVASHYMKGLVTRRYGVIPRVVEPWVDRAQFACDTKEKIILCVARFMGVEDDGNSKKQLELIQTFKKMDLKGWQLICVGAVLGHSDQEYFNKCAVEADSGWQHMEGETMRIRLLPNLSFNALRELYKKAAIYINTVGWGAPDERSVEHFGISMNKAFASGCIVLAHNSGSATVDFKGDCLVYNDERTLESMLGQAVDGYTGNPHAPSLDAIKDFADFKELIKRYTR